MFVQNIDKSTFSCYLANKANIGGVTGFLGSPKISLCEERRLKDTQNFKCEDRRFQKLPSFED